jgi:integrase
MRQGELLGLRWRNVDLDNSRLSVVASLQRANGKAALLEPKTPRSRRQVGLTSIAVSALIQHRQTQRRDRLAAGRLWVESDLVFPNQRGGPLDGHNMVQRDFYPLLRRADLPRIRFHDLRHTAATLMLSQGIHPKVVAEMLGHSTVAVTLDVYSHVTMSLQADAASQLDSLLRRKPLTRGG